MLSLYDLSMVTVQVISLLLSLVAILSSISMSSVLIMLAPVVVVVMESISQIPSGTKVNCWLMLLSVWEKYKLPSPADKE